MKPLPFLRPLSPLYGAAVAARNLLFDAGVLRVRDVGVPVVSVGNLTAGGTGKTPLVEYLVRGLLARGHRPAVVSRGYGRTGRGTVVVGDGTGVRADSAAAGDEPVQIARRFPSAVVVVARRRADAADVAVKQLGADVVVMDDGFQHRWLARDLELVAVDATLDLRREPLLPAGLRREPLSALRRADLVVLTRAGEPALRERARARLGAVCSVPVLASTTRLEGFRDAGDRSLPSDALRGVPVALFSGIGRPAAFTETMVAAGARVVASLEFPDHHPYTEPDIRRVLDAARAAGADRIVTTEKDARRLEGLPTGARAAASRAGILSTRVEAVFLEGEEHLDRRLDGLLAPRC